MHTSLWHLWMSVCHLWTFLSTLRISWCHLWEYICQLWAFCHVWNFVGNLWILCAICGLLATCGLLAICRLLAICESFVGNLWIFLCHLWTSCYMWNFVGNLWIFIAICRLLLPVNFLPSLDCCPSVHFLVPSVDLSVPYMVFCCHCWSSGNILFGLMIYCHLWNFICAMWSDLTDLEFVILPCFIR